MDWWACSYRMRTTTMHLQTQNDDPTLWSTMIDREGHCNCLGHASMVGAVGKNSAIQPKVPSSVPGSVEIQIFVQPSFPPKLTQFSILPG